MDLMTKGIAAKLVKADLAFLESGDGRTSNEIAVKYFNPVGNGRWYIVSGTPLDAVNGEPDHELGADAPDWHMFGYCDLELGPGMAELGYVLLSELKSVKGLMGLGIERDLYYEGHTLDEVMEAV